ncbi:hypothetical protein ACFYNO_04260 [Kitasatospora sp. NPDC006697]|uniref:hypothetical protein n=1 Tax=Kitasatospora sp. NPDC006697 TaxID=3364020 RepID=UPI0036BFDA08
MSRTVRRSVLGLGVAAALLLPSAAAYADGPSAVPSASAAPGRPSAVPSAPAVAGRPTPAVSATPAGTGRPSAAPVPGGPSAVPSAPAVAGKPTPAVSAPAPVPGGQVRTVPRGGAQTGEGSTGPSTPAVAGGAGLALAGLVGVGYAIRRRRADAAR